MVDYMKNELELALAYQPYIRFDENEPFMITAVGYTIFRETSQSRSFPKRNIIVNQNTTAFIIEYAIWYDYDIEHLYDLEHIWIYVSKEGNVIDAEGSFHGKYLKMVNPQTGEVELEEDAHLVVYAQPGKHAFLPVANLVRIIPNWFTSCNETAGSAGILLQDMFASQIITDSELQRKVEQYIKEKYSFEPTLTFTKKDLSPEIFMTYEELHKSIPNRVTAEIDKIKKYDFFIPS